MVLRVFFSVLCGYFTMSIDGCIYGQSEIGLFEFRVDLLYILRNFWIETFCSMRKFFFSLFLVTNSAMVILSTV